MKRFGVGAVAGAVAIMAAPAIVQAQDPFSAVLVSAPTAPPVNLSNAPEQFGIVYETDGRSDDRNLHYAIAIAIVAEMVKARGG